MAIGGINAASFPSTIRRLSDALVDGCRSLRRRCSVRRKIAGKIPRDREVIGLSRKIPRSLKIAIQNDR